MTNPYEPPQERSENRLAELLVPGTYVGGFWGVAVLGVFAGLLVALVIYSEAFVQFIPTPFLAPALAWIGAFVVLLWMLRGSEIGASTRIAVPLLLAIPAYLLYVPVCTFSAMLTTSFMGSNGYGPTFPGLVLASVVTFVVILLLFASILRRRFKQPDPIVAPHVSVNRQTDFSAPIGEPPDE